jgi:membrane protein
MKGIKIKFNIIKDFFENKLWIINIDEYPFFKRYSLHLLRCIVFTLNRYIKDKSTIKASALTYYTMMSIVPLLALILGIARGFGLDNLLEKELRDNVLIMGTSIEKVFEFARNMIANAKGGVFTGLGLGILLYSVVKGLGNIENSFNSIWGVIRKRSIARQFSDYLSVIMILPLFFISLSSINVFVIATMRNLGEEYSLFGSISPYVIQLMQFLPYVITWVFFIFLYIFIPNTKVKFKPAFISGVFIGTLVQLLLWVYIEFQVGVTAYNATYGSFAAIPLLLLWLQMTWSVILVGAQLCYYLQNINGIDNIYEGDYISMKTKRILIIAILHRIVILFKEGQDAESIFDISNSINVKFSHVNKGVNILLSCNLIVEVSMDDDNVFVPALDINKISVANVIKEIDSYGKTLDFEICGLVDDFSQRWEVKFDSVIEKEMGEVLIMDIDKLV